jgi:ParB family chromosome partitioning protein
MGPMSKRVDAIRTLFAQSALSADNAPERAPSGPVRSIRDTFSDVERENDALRAELAGAARVVEIAPELIDPSPFADRFAHEPDAAYLTLKASIEDRGQEVPIMVRPHASAPGRYQAAYGHRRLRAALELKRPVKAIVRALVDDDLVIAQGLENSAREDLSFIERAIFACSMEDTGIERATIQQALAVDRAEASKLISVARAVPRDIVLAIGKAAKVGRPRWLEFAESLKAPAALKRVRKAIAEPGFREAAPDERFLRALRAAKAVEAPAKRPAALRVNDAAGAPLAHLRAGRREVRLELTKYDGARFAEFLAERLPELCREFSETQGAAD